MGINYPLTLSTVSVWAYHGCLREAPEGAFHSTVQVSEKRVSNVSLLEHPLNSINFITYSPISHITNLPQGFTTCTHTTSLTFDLWPHVGSGTTFTGENVLSASAIVIILIHSLIEKMIFFSILFARCCPRQLPRAHMARVDRFIFFNMGGNFTGSLMVPQHEHWEGIRGAIRWMFSFYNQNRFKLLHNTQKQHLYCDEAKSQTLFFREAMFGPRGSERLPEVGVVGRQLFLLMRVLGRGGGGGGGRWQGVAADVQVHSERDGKGTQTWRKKKETQAE